MSKIPSADVLAGGWAKTVYYTLGSLHDFAYFGYITVQPLIFHRVLQQAGFDTYSFQITIFVISTHLFWQVILETPTGAYADSKGRMRAVRDHFTIRVVCMLLLLVAIFLSVSNQGSYVPWLVLGCLFLIELGMAAAEALLSGSFDAWLVDTLAASGQKGEAGRTFSTAATLFNLAILIAMPLFLFLVALTDNGASYFVTGLAAVVFAVGAMLAHASRREVYRIGVAWAERSRATVKTTWREGLSYLWDDRIVWWTTMLKAAPFAAWVVISWIWPLLLKGSQTSDQQTNGHVATVALAALLACSRILGSGASFVVQKLTGSLTGLVTGTGFNLLMAFFTGLSLFYVDQETLNQVVRSFISGESSPLMVYALFFGGSIFLAKGSEEIVKILNQLFLANYIRNDTVRATVSSFTTAAGNLMGFILINLGLVLTWTQATENAASFLLLFVTCSGAILAVAAVVVLRRLTAPVIPAIAEVAD